MEKAVACVIVDHAYRLHERVHDRWSDKAKAALFQVFREARRELSVRRHVGHAGEIVPDRFVIDVSPEKVRQRTKLALQRQCGFRILNHTVDFEPIADNARIGEQGGDFGVVVRCNFLDIPVVKRFSIILLLCFFQKKKKKSHLRD